VHHAQQYATEDQEWTINWSPVLCPTGATLISSNWYAVGPTGMTFTVVGIEDGWFTTIRATGGEPGGIYIQRNDVVVEIDGELNTYEDRVEFYILP
jgi:hypothetical protein